MALYAANFTDWALADYRGTADRISAFGILRLKYPNSIIVPNLGMNLRIFTTSAELYAHYDLVNPLVPVTDSYEISSPKNSINADDYILSGTAPVQVLFEVG